MTAYYNENDPYAAQWLRNLIEEKLIAYGYVDDRSIAEVTAADLADYQQCHFFAGLGGWSGALRLAGVPDDTPLWTGSCPCQPFSLAGKQAGFGDERHLWPTWQRLIEKRRPAVVLGEQVASAAAWLGLVRGDLEALGYAVGCIPVEAASAGAYHLRDRYWFVAQSAGAVGPEQRPEPCRLQDGFADTGDTGGVGHASLQRLALGSIDTVEPGAVRQEGPTVGASSHRGNGVADAAWREPAAERGNTDEVRGVQEQNQPENRAAIPRRGGATIDLADAERAGSFPGAQPGIHREQEGPGSRDVDAERHRWVVGADGKTRRVEPGIRLLAHGVPQRVAKLRALGNAIDLRPAAAFIRAAL